MSAGAAADRRAGSASLLEEQYGDGRYLAKVPGWHASDAPWKAALVRQMLEKHGLRPRSIADVGCGAGAVLRILDASLPAHVELTGYDVSPDAIALCGPHAGGRLRYRQADFVREPGVRADLVLLLDVFEHVPDYLGFLERLRERAEWFLFHVPLDLSVQALRRDSAWLLEQRRRYGHLHYFSRATALATLRELGYAVEDWQYTDDQQTWDPAGLSWKGRALYELRRRLARRAPDLAAQLFEGFSALILARAD